MEKFGRLKQPIIGILFSRFLVILKYYNAHDEPFLKYQTAMPKFVQEFRNIEEYFPYIGWWIAIEAANE